MHENEIELRLWSVLFICIEILDPDCLKPKDGYSNEWLTIPGWRFTATPYCLRWAML